MEPTLTKIKHGGYFDGITVTSDAPVGLDGDKLAFGRYVEPLISVLVDPAQQTPFTIGIFGPWGSGKSSLLRMLREKLEKDFSASFLCVDFNPWMYRNETNMLAPLLRAIRAKAEKTHVESAKKIASILTTLGADLLLRTFTADKVSVSGLEALEEKYLQRRSEVDSELALVRENLSAAIRKIGRNLVLLVDDLDRCEPDQIMSVLESVKLFLDLPNVFVVLAVDREVVRRGIQVRYKDFKFADQRQDSLGHEYLEKMVQLPLELFPLAEGQVQTLIGELLPGTDSPKVELRALVEALAPSNPRRVKRLFNIFAVVRSLMLQSPELKGLNEKTVMRLIALQVHHPDLYWSAVEMPELLYLLERRYREPGFKESEYQQYRNRELMKTLCEQYYQPETVLDRLFGQSTFETEKAQLPLYLSMLGGSGTTAAKAEIAAAKKGGGPVG